MTTPQPTLAISRDLYNELKFQLTNSNVLMPGCPGYIESIERWTESAIQPAGLVVYAGSAEDVSTTILFCKRHSLPFVAVGGRHSTSGISSTNGGVAIDLARLNTVTVDPASKTITTGGGAVWREVDEAAAKHGLATVGGTINHTGCGGLTLGGGCGWQSGKHGLTVDNLLSARVVLADGRIVTASEAENEDLFWALRGAGRFFGVATEFVYRAFEQRSTVWAGVLFYPGFDKLEKLVEFLNHLGDTTSGEAGMFLGTSSVPHVAEIVQMCLAVVFYNGPEDKAKEVFAPIIELGPQVNTAQMIPYEQLNSILNPVAEFGERKCTKGPSFKLPVRYEFIRGVFEELGKHYEELPDGRKSLILLEYVHPTAINRVSQTATAYANRGSELQNCMVGAFWTKPEDDSKSREWARRIYNIFGEELQRNKKDSDDAVGQYANYDGLGSSARALFGVNYDRVAELKKKYDPENAFGQLKE